MLAFQKEGFLLIILFSLMVWTSGVFAQDAETGDAEAETVVVEVAPGSTEVEASEVEETVTEEPTRPPAEWDLPVSPDESVSIRKIYEFLNDPKVTKTGKDRSLEYEFKYFNHGAITKAQRYNREGQYYVVTWTNHGSPTDYVLRLDYRQGKTRDTVKTIEIPYPNAQGTFKGTFSVTGDDYHLDGNVLSWRISVVRNGQIVAQKKSFVW